ncbi:small heat shock protein, chloroplastic-like isoform X2 [Actinidia eriantha]|uniref:small heat shock protein, chloroplastic-like isoform X2 n=1 Tax=Actinidia eriantha TaxID=165200 RepID=UPI002585F915|nr:small heat shock protein, chloroplastic-like isoform X2 [Actinidia eriantha]
MASSLAFRRATAFSLLNRIVRPIRSASAVPSVARSFNTDVEVTRSDEGERSVDVARRSDSVPSFFSDVFDPFSPTRSLSQVLNLMDQLLEDPFLSASRGIGSRAAPRRGWNVKEDNDALYLRIEMPGLDKGHVKISVEQNTLVIKGEGDKESEDDEFALRYSSRIDLPPNLYKIDQIKAEMKNGVLKIVVPKVKEEERKDVFQVPVEG